MKLFSRFFLTACVLFSYSLVANAQSSFVMTFTTGAYGSHRTDISETEESESTFLGLSLNSANTEQQRSAPVYRRETEKVGVESETASYFNREVGKGYKQTEVNGSIEYDFANYNFVHSVEFDY